jgi:hypothetical protein
MTTDIDPQSWVLKDIHAEIESTPCWATRRGHDQRGLAAGAAALTCRNLWHSAPALPG